MNRRFIVVKKVRELIKILLQLRIRIGIEIYTEDRPFKLFELPKVEIEWEKDE